MERESILLVTWRFSTCVLQDENELHISLIRSLHDGGEVLLTAGLAYWKDGV
jgi:hypothetical protein